VEIEAPVLAEGQGCGALGSAQCGEGGAKMLCAELVLPGGEVLRIYSNQIPGGRA
jgi:hypothetical protein